jgi:hypothetical protein
MTSFFVAPLEYCSDKRILRHRNVVTQYLQTLFKNMLIVRRDRTRDVHQKSRVQFWGRYWKLTTKHVIKVSLTHRSSCICLLYTHDRFSSVRMRLILKTEYREYFMQKQNFQLRHQWCQLLKYYGEFKKLFATKKFLEGLRNFIWF